MHGVPAFRAFGAPRRGTPLPYPPACARIAGLGPIPRPPRAGPRVRPGPSANRRAARLSLFEGAERSDQGSGALHALQLRRLRQQAAPSERRGARQIEFAHQFPKPEVFRLAAVPAFRGHQAVLRNPNPPGTSSTPKSVPCGLGMGPATRVRVSNSFHLELPAPPSRERHARRATAGQHRSSRRPRRSGHAHLQPHRDQRCARHNVFAFLLRRPAADPRS